MSSRKEKVKRGARPVPEPAIPVRNVIFLSCLIVPLFFLRNTRSSFLIPKAVCGLNLAILGAALWLIWWVWGRTSYHHTRLSWPLLALMAAFLLSIPGSQSIPEAFIALSRVTGYLVFFFLAACTLRRERDVRILYYLLVFSASLAALIGIMEAHGIRFFPWSETVGRLAIISTFGNPNYLAGFLVAVIPLGLALTVINRRKVLFWPLLAASALMLSCVYVTQTRGSWISLALSLPLFVSFVLARFSAIKLSAEDHRKMLTATVVIILALAVMMYVAGRGRVRYDRLTSLSNVRQRFMVWQVTRRMALDHLMHGVGLGNFKVQYMQYQADFFEEPANAVYLRYHGKAVQTHNDYLQLLAETGIPGVAALGWVFWSLLGIFSGLFNLRRDYGEGGFLAAGAATALFGVAVHALVSFPLHLPATSLVVCLVAGISAGFVDRLLSKKGEVQPESVPTPVPDPSDRPDRSAPSGVVARSSIGTVIPLLVSLAVILGALVAVLHLNRVLVAHYYWKRGIDSLGQRQIPDQKRFSGAAHWCHRALDFAPWSGAIRSNYADFLARSVQELSPEVARPVLERAQAEYIKAAKSFIKREMYNDIGNVLLRQGKEREAEKAYLEGARIDPNFSLVKTNLGNFYLKKGRYDEAEKWYVKSLALSKNQPSIWLNTGMLRTQSGRMTEAAVAYGYAARYSPGNPKAFYFLAQAEERLGRLEQAAEHYRQALILSERRLLEAGREGSDDPLLATIRHRMGSVLGRSNRLTESVEALRAAYEYNPDSEPITCDLGVALGHQGHLTEAVNVFKKGLVKHPTSTGLLLNMGTAYLRLFKFKRAEVVLNMILTLDPDSKDAEMARVYLEGIKKMLDKKKVLHFE